MTENNIFHHTSQCAPNNVNIRPLEKPLNESLTMKIDRFYIKFKYDWLSYHIFILIYFCLPPLFSAIIHPQKVSLSLLMLKWMKLKFSFSELSYSTLPSSFENSIKFS